MAELAYDADKDLLRQLEAALGAIQQGWREDGAGQPLPFQIVECHDDQGRTFFSTLGLSRIPLHLNESDRELRFELVLPAPRLLAAMWMVAALADLGMMCLRSERAPARGDHVAFGAEMVGGRPYTGVYFTLPLFLSPEQWTLHSDDGPVVLIWCLPISTEEVELIASHGWGALEERLEGEVGLMVAFRT